VQVTAEAQTVRLVAALPGQGRADLSVRVPVEGVVTLDLPRGRLLDVEVVELETRRPIPGAHVVVIERRFHGPDEVYEPYEPTPMSEPTDERGRTQVRGLALDDEAFIAAWAEGHPSVFEWGGPRTRIGPREKFARVELAALQELRWQIAREDPHAPPSGTRLELFSEAESRNVMPRDARVVGREVVLEPRPSTVWIDARAVAPDGSFVDLHSRRTDVPVAFRPPRDFVVRVRDAEGRRVPGVWVEVSGRIVRADREDPAFRAFSEPRAAVRLLRGPRLRGGWEAGTPAIQDGVNTFDVTLPHERDYVLRVLSAGSPAASDQVSVSADQWALPAWRGSAPGEVHFRARPWTPDGRIAIEVRSPGHAVAATEIDGTTTPDVELVPLPDR
jgi:hypothetical protein